MNEKNDEEKHTLQNGGGKGGKNANEATAPPPTRPEPLRRREGWEMGGGRGGRLRNVDSFRLLARRGKRKGARAAAASVLFVGRVERGQGLRRGR